MNAPFDPGLQPERTELAWRRTALAVCVGSIVAMRLLPVALGHGIWVLAGVIGLVAAGGFWVAARLRYRTVHHALVSHPSRPRLPGTGIIFALALFACTVGVTCLVIVAMIHLSS